jgi:hypothetical protein
MKTEDIKKAQQGWANGIIEIGSFKDNLEECKKKVNVFLDNYYCFSEKEVLFKPTKTKIEQFRFDKRSATSYFVGEDELYKEDKGFALAPWEKIRFENKGFLFEKNRSIAMGNYYFKAVNSNEEIKVEYTFGYCMGSDGNLKIDLHHSSLPYRC